MHAPLWLKTGVWDRVAVAANEIDEWRPVLQISGINARKLIELPVDDAATLEQIVRARFPDPLADTLATAGAATGVRIGIFGTGAAALKVWEVVAELDTADAVWFADNNPQQHGRSILGLDVIAPGSIPATDVDAIVIGSMARDAICEQLLALGLPGDRIVTVDVAGPMQTLRDQVACAVGALPLREAA